MAHFCKINSGSTERLLLRNSSKDTENSDKNFRKEVKALEVIDKLKEVVKALDAENSDEREDENFRKETKAPEFMDKLKEVVKALNTENSKIMFHSHSTLESPQNSKIVFHSTQH